MRRSNYTARNLLSEKKFLWVAARARRVHGIQIISVEYDKNEVIFRCNSVSTPGKVWVQRVAFEGIDEFLGVEKGNKRVNPNQALLQEQRKQALENRQGLPQVSQLAKFLREAKIKITCDCPAYEYWGYKYIGWRKGYSLTKETRRPRVRNPQQRGHLCKHLYAVLNLLPLLSTPIARNILKKAQLR